ncbi:hypothetical protein SAY87_005422 [Trapa incisa]|uniref:Uncharacterized protein n=1 Tax=Trapa incisa TaxID=236973 RepID=A0AAN7K8T4_9MYRT|nr:hypothetical protein SAY87_005422 [Trapa incisa]
MLETMFDSSKPIGMVFLHFSAAFLSLVQFTPKKLGKCPFTLSSKLILSEDKNLSSWLSKMRQLIHGKSGDVSVEAELAKPVKSHDRFREQDPCSRASSLWTSELFLSSESSGSLERAMSTLLSEKSHASTQCSSLYKVWEQISSMCSFFKQNQSDLLEVTEKCSLKDSLQADLSAKTLRLDRLQKVDANYDRDRIAGRAQGGEVDENQ